MKQIIVNCTDRETRIALLENKKLMELFVERPAEQKLAGNIYKGKVVNVLPGMEAAFVDIGADKNAFLYVDDCLPAGWKERNGGKKPGIREVLTEGQELLVQVTKEPLGTKGARVTAQISFPGRYLVYMPEDPYIGISRKIEEEEERKRLRLLLTSSCEQKEGAIVRTAAAGVSEEELKADLSFLRGLWEKCRQAAKSGKPPRIVHRELDLVQRVIRDHMTADVDEIVIDRAKEYRSVLENLEQAIPNLGRVLKMYAGRTSLFAAYGVEAEIERALQRKVWLKSGGYLIIDQTEAFTSIDVNTGKFTGSHRLEETVFQTNLEAAQEIARQLRLRDIGGIILIDFIDMHQAKHRDEVYFRLQQELKKDRTKSHLLGFTQLGLLEMTRKKVRQNLQDMLMTPCPYCAGKGKILSEETVLARIEREIQEYAKGTEAEAMLVEVHPHLADLLAGPKEENLKRLRQEWGMAVYLKGNERMHRQDYHIAYVGSLQEAERRL